MKELLTGKNKEQFQRWFHNNEAEKIFNSIDSIIPYGTQCFDAFNMLSFEMQIGVLLAYYDSLDILIQVEMYDDGNYWRFKIYRRGSKFYKKNCELELLDSRPEAYKQAFIKANEIVNESIK